MKSFRKFVRGLAIVVLTCQSAQAATVKLRFPIANADRGMIAGLPIIGKDHDGSKRGDKLECRNYRGAKAPFCYNGHGGTDFSLIGGFVAMDRGSAQVVAAADGVVVDVVDGYFDRCSALNSKFETDCYGHKMIANQVTIKHKDGTKTRYLHLMKNSIVVREGQAVKCGQPLGLVGSSGNSSIPHLHFDVFNTDGDRVDPYAGMLSQTYSYWINAFESDGLPSGACRTRYRPDPNPQCKWETIQDVGTCGLEIVTNAVACGVETVTSANECGVDTIRSASQCGTEYITSATECGTKIVKSATQCGVEIINNIA